MIQRIIRWLFGKSEYIPEGFDVIEIDGKPVHIKESHLGKLLEEGVNIKYADLERGYEKDWRVVGGNEYGVKYVNPLLDHSGYAQAGRNEVKALMSHTRLKLENVRFDKAGYFDAPEWLDFSWDGDYDVVIIHLTPENYLERLEPGKYHIARFVWETSKIPHEFVWALNRMDEVWTTDGIRKDQFIKSGVKVPIHIVPEVVRVVDEPEELFIPQVGDDTYIFYSIFQWTERKNPWAMISAYWDAFGPEDDVVLLLKTYGPNFSKTSKYEIVHEIDRWKQKDRYYPPVILYQNYMSGGEIMGLHERGDCYVQTSRGEGWGIPLGVAGLMGNSLIYSSCGGVSAYLPKMLKDKMVQVHGMQWIPWYYRDQEWVEVDVNDLSEKMRSFYEGESNDYSDLFKEKFSEEHIGNLMMDRIKKIRGGGVDG